MWKLSRYKNEEKCLEDILRPIDWFFIVFLETCNNCSTQDGSAGHVPSFQTVHKSREQKYNKVKRLSKNVIRAIWW